MKEIPIIFNAEMVRAIINNRKTQTRRMVKFDWCRSADELMQQASFDPAYKCPYGKVGDRLWVRETWGLMAHTDQTDWHRGSVAGESPDSIVQMFSVEHLANWRVENENAFWRPSIHMPRWASRITLEITGVRVERLHDISDEDAKAEGVSWTRGATVASTPKSAFCRLWESLHGLGSWDANPFVWVIEFRKETKP